MAATGLGAGLAAVIVRAGCGGGKDEPASPATSPATVRQPARPALCGRLDARVTGHVASDAAQELSGLVLSRRQPRILWSHNDSGDEPRVLAFTPEGTLRADLRVPGAENVDWEDIALGDDRLFLGDIGDNAAGRSEIVVYATHEPLVPTEGAVHGATAPGSERFALRYPDGAHDAETLLVDRATGGLVIVTKSFAGNSRVYVARRPSPTGTVTLRLAAKLSFGVGEAVTAGDVSGDGRTVVLRTYDKAFVFTRQAREPLARTLRRKPCVAHADLAEEGQGEALALTADGRAFYTVPEGRRPAIRRYAAAK